MTKNEKVQFTPWNERLEIARLRAVNAQMYEALKAILGDLNFDITGHTHAEKKIRQRVEAAIAAAEGHHDHD